MQMSIPLLILASCAARIPRIEASELAQTLAETPDRYVVVDVRSEREWRGRKGHIEGAVHMPFPGVKDRAHEIEADPGQEVVLVCFTGHRSRWAMKAVTKAMDVPVQDLRGGMMAWWRHDLPTQVEPEDEPTAP